MARDGWDENWLRQRERRRHAEQAKVTPGRVAAAINFYAPPGMPVVGPDLKPLPEVNPARPVPADDFVRLCLADGLPEPCREYPIDGTRRYRWDYAWPRFRVAVEKNGGIWMQAEDGHGAHSRPANIIRDMAKNNVAVRAGWRVLYYTPQQLLAGAVAEVAELLR